MDKTKQASKSRERRLRAKYRRNLRIAVIFCLVIGLAAGFVAGRLTAPSGSVPLFSDNDPSVPPTVVPTEVPTAVPTAVPTEIPTEAPTAVPTAQPTVAATPATTATVDVAMAGRPAAEPTARPAQATITIVPYGESQDITVQALSDGTARKDNGSEPFETLNFTMHVTRYLSNDYYTTNYGSTHRLDAGTAGVEFELLLNDYMGNLTIDPNELIKEVGVETENGVVTLGYRFTDAEISGSDKITLTTNVPTLMYKRFTETDSKPIYLTAVVQIDGASQVYKFELNSPESEATPEPTAEPTPMPELPTMREGDKGSNVETLQNILIDKGYLEEGSADGDFGRKTTEAVKQAQTDLGITADGIAGPGFYRAIAAN